MIQYDWMLLLLPMPFFIGMLMDALAWKQLLPPHLAVPFKSLFGVQVGAEAVLLSIPGGFAMADPIKLYLLKKMFRIPSYEIVASLIMRHWMLGITQLIFIFISCLIGYIFTQQMALSVYAGNGTFILAAGMLIIISVALGLIVKQLMRGTLARNIWKFLYRIHIKPLRRWLKRMIATFREADNHFLELGKKKPVHLIAAFLLYLVHWMMDVGETLLAVHVIGFHISFVNALFMEAFLSAVRLGAFFLPSGAGVKDIGYVALAKSLNLRVVNAQIVAFIVFKRIISIFCILVGYVVLLVHGIGPNWKRSVAYKAVMESK
jgi:hypothetical protein